MAKIIDCHVHAFPTFMAEKAMKKLTENCDYQPCSDGTLATTKRVQAEWNCHHFILLNIATAPQYVEKVNDFLIAENRENIIPYGSIHPLYKDYKKEIKRLAENGIRGIKFHPEYQEFNLDDVKMFPIYEEIAKNNMVMLFHSGFDPAYQGSDRSHVRRGGVVADTFKGAKLTFAHLGNLKGMADTYRYLVGKDVYFDISMAVLYYTYEEIEKFIKSHGANRFLYATDCPWSSGTATQKMVGALHITAAEKDNIFYKNAEQLLNIRI